MFVWGADRRLASIEQRLAVVSRDLVELIQEFREWRKVSMAHFDELIDEIGKLSTVVESNNALLDRLADELEEHHNEPETIKALAASIREARESISAAIVRNTPSEPPVEPDPTE